MEQAVVNLIKMAGHAYDGKNYRDCENYCNQVIAQEFDFAYAWKLKAMAVNMLSTPQNPRLSEVYTCLLNYVNMSAANKREEAEKKAVQILADSYTGEMEMHLAQLTAGRPTDLAKTRLVDIWNDMMGKMNSFSKICTFSSSRQLIEQSWKSFKKKERKSIYEACNKSLVNTVEYNYYREYASSHGSGWMKGRDYRTGYRPDKSTFDLFIEETAILQNTLWAFAIEPVDEEDARVLVDICTLALTIQRRRDSACSFKRMVETTTNGYGAVLKREEYWEFDYYMKPNAD